MNKEENKSSENTVQSEQLSENTVQSEQLSENTVQSEQLKVQDKSTKQEKEHSQDQEADLLKNTNVNVTLNEQSQINDYKVKIAQLEIQLLASKAKQEEQKGLLLRAKAEVENMRRRTEVEINKAHKYALNKFSEELLPVIDNLERAIQSGDIKNEFIKPILEGVELTYRTFIEVIAKFGLKEINPEKGEGFNPEFHQAMSIEENSNHTSNVIMNVMQKGYELNGRVLRPAMVVVTK
ncbi:nucleotide exchange factor GrpE [Candidatus Photodesmus anomalopis]|nr:nucleotide exchange factor GrpE [Candidatus Photodesmus katoptron]